MTDRGAASTASQAPGSACRTAGRRAFSLIFSITQRDAVGRVAQGRRLDRFVVPGLVPWCFPVSIPAARWLHCDGPLAAWPGPLGEGVLQGGAVCEHVADLALDACAGAHVPQSLVGRVAGVRGLHDRAAAGALAFDDLVHQLPAVPQAVGVAEQPGPARPGSNSAMLNGSVAGSPYSGTKCQIAKQTSHQRGRAQPGPNR